MSSGNFPARHRCPRCGELFDDLHDCPICETDRKGIDEQLIADNDDLDETAYAAMLNEQLIDILYDVHGRQFAAEDTELHEILAEAGLAFTRGHAETVPDFALRVRDAVGMKATTLIGLARRAGDIARQVFDACHEDDE